MTFDNNPPPVYLNGNNGINISTSKKLNISDITIDEFHSGISLPFCELVKIKDVQGFKNISESHISHGITFGESLNVSIEKVQLNNYFTGIFTIFADTCSIEDVTIRSDQIFETSFNRGISSNRGIHFAHSKTKVILI